MDLEEKFEQLALAAEGDVACSTCASNPAASIVVHNATVPLGAGAPAAPHAQRDLKPWLTTVVGPGGRAMPIVKTLMTRACEKDCFYCPTRRGRNKLRRITFKPEELALGMNQVAAKGLAKGIFLSSGVIGGGTRTMDKTIAAIEILRRKYGFEGYVHLKLMPGAERAAIEQALTLADRVSVNLEAPNSERLSRLSSTKQFTEELLEPLRLAREAMEARPEYASKSMTTQFVVGAADESDAEILSTSRRLYQELKLARIYFSAFRPVEDTPLENHAPTPDIRERRLYQSDFLLRRYGFTYEEFVFDAQGNLPTTVDPKTMWAQKHPERFPLDLSRATREEMVRVPGIGPLSASRILELRRDHRLAGLEDLARLGADAKRAAPYILLKGKSPAYQLPLF